MEISIFGFLVEATRFKGINKTLNHFIYKDFRVFTPNRSPTNFYSFSECHQKNLLRISM